MEFAAEHTIPVIRFARGQRKLEVMRPHLDHVIRAGRSGVAAIGVAQEFQRVFTGTTYHADPDGGGIPRFGCTKADRRVTAYWAVSRILDCSSWLSWLSRSLRLVVSEGFGRSAVAEV